MVHTRVAAVAAASTGMVARPAERHGDVLAVHQHVEERLEGRDARGGAARTRHAPDLLGQLRRRERGVPDGGVVDHPLQAAARPEQVERGPAGAGLRQRQVRGDVADPPSRAQRRLLPLRGREVVQQVGQVEPLVVDGRPDGVEVRGPDRMRSHEVPLGN